MNYITRLDRALCRQVSLKTRSSVMADYREYYDSLAAEGKTDEEIAQKLGAPEKLAADIAAEEKGAILRTNKMILFRALLAVVAVGLLIINLLTIPDYPNILNEMYFILPEMIFQTAAFTYLTYVMSAHRLQRPVRFLRGAVYLFSFALGAFYTVTAIYRFLWAMDSSPSGLEEGVKYALIPIIFSLVIAVAGEIIIYVTRRKHESAA